MSTVNAELNGCSFYDYLQVNCYVQCAMKKYGELHFTPFPMGVWPTGVGEEMARTNNVIEGQHQRTKLLCGHDHRAFHKLISVVLEQNVMTEHAIRTHLANGAVLPKRRKKNESNDNAIKNLECLYDEGK